MTAARPNGRGAAHQSARRPGGGRGNRSRERGSPLTAGGEEQRRVVGGGGWGDDGGRGQLPPPLPVRRPAAPPLPLPAVPVRSEASPAGRGDSPPAPPFPSRAAKRHFKQPPPAGWARPLRRRRVDWSRLTRSSRAARREMESARLPEASREAESERRERRGRWEKEAPPPLPANREGRGGARQHGKWSPQGRGARSTTGNVFWREAEGSSNREAGAAGEGALLRSGGVGGLYEVIPPCPGCPPLEGSVRF